jgi:hypothetical protein
MTSWGILGASWGSAASENSKSLSRELAKILLITRLRIMSLFCNYCRIGLTHVISVREIFVSVEIGSTNVRHSSEMAGEILCSVTGNTW